MVAEHPGTTSEVPMTEARHVEADDIIKEESDYVTVGSYPEDEKSMDGEWNIVAQPATNTDYAV